MLNNRTKEPRLPQRHELAELHYWSYSIQKRVFLHRYGKTAQDQPIEGSITEKHVSRKNHLVLAFVGFAAESVHVEYETSHGGD